MKITKIIQITLITALTGITPLLIIHFSTPTLAAIPLEQIPQEITPEVSETPPTQNTPEIPPEAPSPTQAKEDPKKIPLERFLNALKIVETGSKNGYWATGDNGKSIGPLQIQYKYWLDSNTPGEWNNCRDLNYAKIVVHNYWKRYCPQALENLDYETLARIHNGGPSWFKGKAKNNTYKYWLKVKKEM
jgi:hypothetical protein